MNSFLKLLIITLLPLIGASCKDVNPNPVYIRVNQVGFRPNDLKTAVVFSEYPLYNKEFAVVNKFDQKEIFTGTVSDSGYTYGNYKHCYSIDFSDLKDKGTYTLKVDGRFSWPFQVGEKIYGPVVDSLMLFFRVQRCGPTHPFLHKPCHLSDVERVVGYKSSKGVDVTGGWHDAGDYIKFFSTAAYTTYMLLFSYEFDKDKFSFDNNNNSVPDILEEARVGLDWLLRCNFAPGVLVTQVQDLRDHNVGWRMPSQDTLRFDRPGYVGIGKNQIGIFTATLALASRIWASRFYDKEFSSKCLKAAEDLYAVRNNVPDIDNTQSGFYQDSEFNGKMSLGAVELYNSTKNPIYLRQAKSYADSAGSDYWWSWGNINSLADYKLAIIDPRYSAYIFNNLSAFNANKDKSIFREGVSASWGTTNSMLGVTLQAILYKKLTGATTFDSLATYQRDYVLGRNPWGLSFIYNIGSQFPVHLHSQIAYFHNGYLPGALSAGPAPLSVLKNYKIERTDFKYNKFNTDSLKYYDDRNDYITNEPTIVGNATAVFVYGYYSKG